MAVLLLLAGCNREPFSHVAIQGQVTYEDGSPIPAERIQITFEPMVEARDARTHPRPGRVEADPATGEYRNVTTRRYGDGVIRGRHKVLVRAFGPGGAQLPAVPPEYNDRSTTPLELDTDDRGTWDLRVRNPN